MNAPANIRIVQHPQHRKLEAVIEAANAALPAAARGELFDSPQGYAFFAAVYALNGCDSEIFNCFNTMRDIAHVCRMQLED